MQGASQRTWKAVSVSFHFFGPPRAIFLARTGNCIAGPGQKNGMRTLAKYSIGFIEKPYWRFDIGSCRKRNYAKPLPRAVKYSKMAKTCSHLALPWAGQPQSEFPEPPVRRIRCFAGFDLLTRKYKTTTLVCVLLCLSHPSSHP